MKQSSNASIGRWPIVPEIILHCTLCYLAGGSVNVIRVRAGMSYKSFIEQLIKVWMIIMLAPRYPLNSNDTI
jgi:hypothetical protein